MRRTRIKPESDKHKAARLSGAKKPRKAINKVSDSPAAKRRQAADRRGRKQHKGAVCIVTGETTFDVAHISGKGAHPELRDVDINRVPLVRRWHDYYGTRPVEWRELIETKYPGRWEELERLSLELSKGCVDNRRKDDTSD